MERTPAYEGKKDFIFVSYAHKNSELVLPMINRMYEDKYRVWYDEGIAPGSEWPHNIETHLKSCNTCLFFISKESIASINCENEVINAIEQKKNIYSCSLDGSEHELLKNYKTYKNFDDLYKDLPSNLIGDGSGYDSTINNKKHLSIWNVLLIVVILMIIGLAIGLYALEKGYFDEYLPGRRVVDTTILQEEATTEVEIDNELIEEAIKKAIGEGDEYDFIVYTSEDNKEAFLDGIGFYNWDIQNELTYHDLRNNETDAIGLRYGDSSLLELLKWFPNLKYLYIDSPEMNDLSSLIYCKNLEIVYVTENNFPLVIPENRNFEIIYRQKVNINLVPIVVGVTGHRRLRVEDYPLLKEKVRQELKKIKDKAPDSPLILLDSLALGGDALCAEVALELGYELEVPLPFEESEYRKDFDEENLKIFDEQKAKASKVFELNKITDLKQRDDGYRDAGLYIATHSHIVIALWDGEKGKPGGYQLQSGNSKNLFT